MPTVLKRPDEVEHTAETPLFSGVRNDFPHSVNWENARVAAILETAAHCFAEGGFITTTLADIGKKLGLRKSIVHYYFVSKARLVGEVQSYAYGHYLGIIRESLFGPLADERDAPSSNTRLRPSGRYQGSDEIAESTPRSGLARTDGQNEALLEQALQLEKVIPETVISEPITTTKSRSLNSGSASVRLPSTSPSQPEGLRTLWAALQQDRSIQALNLELWSTGRHDPELAVRAALFEKKARALFGKYFSEQLGASAHQSEAWATLALAVLDGLTVRNEVLQDDAQRQLNESAFDAFLKLLQA